MNFLSLFSGIGGFDLGLERAGMKCVGQVEKDPFCLRVLAHHWPNVKRIEDIRDVTGLEFGTVKLVCGGFPCQPFSCAGKRKGKGDDRYLWPQMFRVIKAANPDWIIGENVPGIIRMELDNLLADLESIGYQVQPFIIPACAVDAPHRRDRVWIIAHRTGNGLEVGRVAQSGSAGQLDGSGKIRNVADTECLRRRESTGDVDPTREPFCPTERQESALSIESSSQDVPDSHGSGFGERRRPESVQPEHGPAQCAGQNVSYAVNDGYNRTEGHEAEQSSHESNNRIFERGNTWLPEPGVGRVAHGIPGRVDRLRSLGNSVVPQIVEIIGRAIMNIETIIQKKGTEL